MLAAARLDHPGARCRRGVGDTVGVEYVSRVPRPPLDGLIDDLYYLEGAPPYARLTLPPPAALLIVNLGAPFRIRAGTDIETAEYADGCVVTMPTRAWEFGYPPWTRSVGVHFKPWGLAPFLPMPAAELCDRPVTVEQATSSGRSPGSRRPGTSKSGGGSCANIPATCWTAGRCRPIDFLQERQLTTR
jgi:hypothetical protein